ncbi:MAG: hypothetical protein JWO56_1087, partial [Acidobacteria bacterium]|nr:hypothetical protein [Acidobacteriota bacterium]
MAVNRRRLTFLAVPVCVAWGIFASSPLQAFSGPEHRDLSNAALRLAVLHARAGFPDECAKRASPCARMLDVAYDLSEGAIEPLHTFGDLTRAVDLFQNPDILTYEVAWTHLDERRRLSRWLLQGLALHRNRAHFQVEALNAYARYHDQAIVFGRRHEPRRALYSEAVALHFLQDFFAAGHFVTPRGGFHDAVAASLHDRYNIDGVDVAVTIPKVGPWKTLLKEMSGQDPFEGELLRFTPEDVERFTALDGKNFRAGGDRCLSQIPEQRVLLALASAESIVEVIESAVEVPEYIIDVCFEPRSAERGSGNKPVVSSRRGPDGGVGVTATKHGWPRLVGPCETSEAQPLARYRLNTARLVSRAGVYPASGIEVTALSGRGFHTSDHRRIIDVNWIIGALEPSGSLHVRQYERDTGEVFYNARFFSYLAAHLSLVRGQHFRAIGYGNEYGLDIPVL